MESSSPLLGAALELLRLLLLVIAADAAITALLYNNIIYLCITHVRVFIIIINIIIMCTSPIY